MAKVVAAAAAVAVWEIARAAADDAGMEFACGCGRVVGQHLPTGGCKAVLQPKRGGGS